MDVNKTTHIGTASTNPTLTTLGSGTTIAFFTLKVKESWKNKAGQNKSRYNLLKFEALGNKAHWVKANVKAGRRYYIDGTDRVEEMNGKECFSKRIYHIEELGSEEFDQGMLEGRRESLSKAVNIVKSSDELSIAQAKLELLLSEL